MTNQIIRRRPALFTFVGRVTKSGAGWFLVEGPGQVEKHIMTERDQAGNPVTSEVHYYPSSVLVTFAKTKDFHNRVTANKEMRFEVEVSVGWDERFKKPVPRFWLMDVHDEEPSVFQDVVDVLGQQEARDSSNPASPTVPPAPAPAPTPEPQQPTPTPPLDEATMQNVNIKPRPAKRSSRYVK